jgi:hypothetical protein
VIPAIVAFASGFAVDVLAVLWTRFVIREDITAATLCSMALGTAQICSIGAAVRDWHAAPFFVAGYGLGSAVAIWFGRKGT